MNDVFKLFLDKSVVVYLDVIVVFSENMEDHKRHLEDVWGIEEESVALEVQVSLGGPKIHFWAIRSDKDASAWVLQR